MCKRNKFVDTLIRMHQKNSQNISEQSREILYGIVAHITTTEAISLSKDLTYLYVCALHDDTPNQQRLEILPVAFEKSFIYSLVDLGTLMDKLSDATHLNCESRIKKWNGEKAKKEYSADQHKQKLA